MTLSTGSSAEPYVLGHTPGELERLNAQARVIDPITLRFLQAAGIGPGQRVLDVGSGAGDVSFLAADLVGRSGQVVGVDRAAAGIALATKRASDRAIDTVTFVQGDAVAMAFDQPFDAVIGRYVLMFQPDPAALLAALRRHLKPGGLMAFHEVDYAGCHSVPPAPLYDACCRWVAGALAATSNTRMGLAMPAAFRAAALPPPSLRMEALVGANETSADAVGLITGLVGTLLPEIERLGLATENDILIGTLKNRVMADVMEHAAMTFGRYEIGAWCRV